MVVGSSLVSRIMSLSPIDLAVQARWQKDHSSKLRRLVAAAFPAPGRIAPRGSTGLNGNESPHEGRDAHG